MTPQSGSDSLNFLSNRQRTLISAATIATLAICAQAAQAANVIVGSPLVGPFGGATLSCGLSPCTLVQDALPGAVLTSPVDGAVVRWQFLGADTRFAYKLRVLKPEGGLGLTGAGTSDAVTPVGSGKESFPTVLPIRAGQRVGINLVPGASIAEREVGGADYLIFRPILLDGQTRAASEGRAAELAFNAEVQPAPKITSVSPIAGSVQGGNTVTIAGTDLEGASAVSFGGAAAASYRVDSAGQITAVAPAVSQASAVTVSVTTIAGTATSPTPYGYSAEPCVTPKLKGMKLNAAKRKLKKARCRIGRVKATKGATARTGKVVKQMPRPGKARPVGTKVNVTLG